MNVVQSHGLILDSAQPQKNILHVMIYIHTMCMSCPDTTVQGEAPILQNAVVLYPHVLVFVHFMKQSKTLWVFHSQWRQIRVVSGDIHPHVILKQRS